MKVQGVPGEQVQILPQVALLLEMLKATKASDLHGALIDLEEAGILMRRWTQAAHRQGDRLLFIGNGGSAAIASHMAMDYAKNGFRALCFDSPPALTAWANDEGYDAVFSAQIAIHARAGDVLVAISSSGESPNILRAVETARGCGCRVITFSGKRPGNQLRGLGNINFYIGNENYGLVEVGHHILCHFVLNGLTVEKLTEVRFGIREDALSR